MQKVIVSLERVSELAGITVYGVRAAVQRGRLIQGDALIDGTVKRGITWDSLVEYYGWSPATCDEILMGHMVPKGARAYLTVRDPNEPARSMTYGDAARRAEVEATYKKDGE